MKCTSVQIYFWLLVEIIFLAAQINPVSEVYLWKCLVGDRESCKAKKIICSLQEF